MSNTLHSSSNAGSGFDLRGLLNMVTLNIVIPFLLYQFSLRSISSSEVVALSIAALFLALKVISVFLINRSADSLALLLLAGFIACIVTSTLTHNPTFFLIRVSFGMAALGVACLVSLLFPKPLMFSLGRQFTRGKDPVKLAEYNAKWQYSRIRFVYRMITAVWGMACLSSFILSVVLIYTISATKMTFIGPFLVVSILILTAIWTIAYVRHVARRGKVSKQQVIIPS